MAAERDPRRRPTISDVAQRAGVTKGAVSRALNSGTGVSPQTKERILQAAVDLGWTPSYAARALTGKSLGTIGLVVRRSPDVLDFDPFFASFLAGIESVLSGADHATVVRFVPDAVTERRTYERLFSDRFVDGFLLTDPRVRDDRYDLLDSLGAPGVVVGAPLGACDLPTVAVDPAPSIRAMMRHLVERGHTSIAHVSGDPWMLPARQRRQSWESASRELGCAPGPLAVGDYTAAGGADATARLLERARRPTAIFYGNDLMAIGGLSVLRESGVEVPRDMAVAGFDDITLASFTSPPLTTVRSRHRDMGSTAARMLLELLAGEASTEPVLIADELRLRASTQ